MHRSWLPIFSLLALSICTTVCGQAPEPPPTTTLWNFLGIPQAFNKLHANGVNRRGNHPRLEKKPPLKGIADPSLLKSDVPALKAAAEIKQAEDLKPQKIKAIKYLATIGCGCYDKDEKITKALLASMEDCTEEVRLEAINAINAAAGCDACAQCNERSCCNEKISAQLYKLAYELDDTGCHVEPSERVRQAAMDALRTCCPGTAPMSDVPRVPVEGADRPTPVEGGTQPNAPETPTTPATPPATETPRSARNPAPGTIDPDFFLRDASTSAPAELSSRRTAQWRSISRMTIPSVDAPAPESMGYFMLFDKRRQLAHVHFPNWRGQLAVGSRIGVWIPSAVEPRFVGELEVVEVYTGSVHARPLGNLNVVAVGEEAIVAPLAR